MGSSLRVKVAQLDYRPRKIITLIANLWHGFHEVFLHMVFGLQALTLVTKLLHDPTIVDATSIVGWGRNTCGACLCK